MNPRKWKVNLNHSIFVIYISGVLSPRFITMHGQKYSHICILWGQFLPLGMICTTRYNLYTRGCAVFICKNVLCTHSYIFYSHGCNVRAWNLFSASVAKLVLWQLTILLPCTLAHMSSIPVGAINFYMQEHFLHLLIWSHQFLPW